MDILLQQVLNAVSLGGIYALLALGLAVVFSIVSLINFAHGELMTVAGYGLFFAVAAQVPLPVALLIAVLAAVAAALLTERFAFRPMRGADVTALLLTSFAVSAILRVLFQNSISARGQPVPLPAALSGTLDLGFARVGTVPLLSILVTALSLLALTVFLRRTTLGKAMRAAAEDFQVLRLMGIRANRVIAVAFAVSGVLAGISAALWVAQRGSVDPLAKRCNNPIDTSHSPIPIHCRPYPLHRKGWFPSGSLQLLMCRQRKQYWARNSLVHFGLNG